MKLFILIVLGLICGSFINALIWRLHERSLKKSRKAAENLSVLFGRSMCPNCRHSLGVLDLVPVLSWLVLRGRCRYCQKRISLQYPIVELLTPGLFLFSYFFWPTNLSGVNLVEFIFWLVILVGFISLAVYDIKWMILPNRIIYPLILLAITQLIVVLADDHFKHAALYSAFWGVLIIGGLFYVLFQISGGKWIGGGDVKLGGLLGILVGGPEQAILLIFMASVLGTGYAIPQMLTGKAKRTTKLPFGPFLIISAVAVRLFGLSVINWYKMRFP